MFTAVIFLCSVVNGNTVVSEDTCMSVSGMTEHQTVEACEEQLNRDLVRVEQNFRSKAMLATCLDWSTSENMLGEKL